MRRRSHALDCGGVQGRKIPWGYAVWQAIGRQLRQRTQCDNRFGFIGIEDPSAARTLKVPEIKRTIPQAIEYVSRRVIIEWSSASSSHAQVV